MTDVKVTEFLGVDIKVSSSGKFTANLGIETITGKTMAEVENALAEKITRKAERVSGNVEVVRFRKPAPLTGNYNSDKYKGPDYFENITDYNIVGVNVERTRGRGATTTVNFKTEERGYISARQTFYRNNPDARAELETTMKEWRESNLEFYKKALELLDKFEEIPGTEIYDALMNGPQDGQKLRVVS